MQDIFDYIDNSKNSDKGQNKGFESLADLVSSLSKKFDGKNASELLKAIYEEAEKGKKNGTLSNSDLDNFALMLSPMLDEKKQKILHSIIDKLKEI